MKHHRTLALILCASAVGCRASTEQCEAAFEASLDIAVSSFVADNPNAPDVLLKEVRAGVDKKRRDNYMKTCAGTSPAVAECMAAAKTLEAQGDCVPK